MSAQDIEYVRLADHVDHEGQGSAVFARLDDLTQRVYFDLKKSRKSLRHLSVGHVYMVPTEVGEDGKPSTFHFGKRDWRGRWKDEDAAREEQAKNLTSEALRAARSREAKGSSDRDVLEASIEALAVAYEKLPAPHRLAFEVWVMSRLRFRKMP